MTRLLDWIAGLGPLRRPPTPEDTGASVLASVESILDQVGEDADVGLRRRWKEDCRSYRFRLQIFLQEEIIRRERYERFLTLLLQTERS